MLILTFCAIGFLLNSEGALLGGESQVDVNSPNILRLSNFALEHLNKGRSLTEEKTQLLKVLDATVQVVAGTLTKLTLQVVDNKVNKECILKIWEQPWISKIEVTESMCEERFENTPNMADIGNTKTRMEKKVSMKLFKNFILKYNKNYTNEEQFNKRFHIFNANLKKIKTLQEMEQGTAQYGITEFADLSAKEFKKYLGLNIPKYTNELPMAEIPIVELPEEFNWQKHNAVTSVKDQKSCGSCWAFSAIGNIEGQWAIKKNQLLSLSEQELLDCDKIDEGCKGGYMTTAFKEIIEMGGLETEKSYPYDAKNEECHLNKSEIRVKISGAVNLTQSEEDIAKWLFKNGPVSAALNANAMQFYFGGVSHPFKIFCDPNTLDHGILIVGFGIHKTSILNRTLPYWVIKNSWGKKWGEKGYYRLYRGDGSCGINKAVSSSVIN